MKKTFWSVDYTVIGADTRTAWFESKAEAETFYNEQDYVDRPQAHTFSKPESIREHDDLVDMTEGEIATRRQELETLDKNF